MSKCEQNGCSVEFGVLAHKYTCSCCAKMFCYEHACKYTYISQFAGLHIRIFHKVIKDEGYICKSCFSKTGLDLDQFNKSIFDRVCGHPDCNVSLNSILNSKYSCISCGKLYCSHHAKLSKSDVTESWLKQHTHYPLAEKVCNLCHGQKSAEYTPTKFIEHPKTSFLRLMAGDINGARQTIIVHGILSNYKSMLTLSESLVSKGVFDTVWCLDDIAYRGRVNESKKLGLALIPMGLGDVAKGLIKVIGQKALEVIDLPAYIVEGAAQTLFMILSSLQLKNMTIIGHSLGGIVSRCLVESYDVSPYVDNVITLASPHQLWLFAQKSKLSHWKAIPNENIRYLAIVAQGDWIAREGFSNYTSDDGLYKNIVKILVDGNHTSVHGVPYATYMPDLINGFMRSFDEFYIEVEQGIPYLKYIPFHGAKKGDSVEAPIGKWIEFNLG